MTHIKPFKAIHYNQSKIADLSKVVCPPYDVISPEEQNEYHAVSPYNFIHVLLGKDQPSDNEHENKYSRAKRIFENWLRTKILEEDEKPCIYYYKQDYRILGQKYRRLGFIALMKLQDEEESKVFPHENTHAKAIEDRFRLWSNLNSNLSAIFVCFSDKSKKVQKTFTEKVSSEKPFIDIIDNDQIRHVVWRLDDLGLIEGIAQSLSNQQLFIADGHHRYEVAREYRKAQLSKVTKSSGQEPFQYVMTYFTNLDSSDLQILPMHRIVKELPGDLNFLEDLFRMDRVNTKENLQVLLAKAGQNEHAFGLYQRDGIKLLRLKNKALVDENIKEGSKEFRSLDATILKGLIFDRMGIKSEDIMYTKDIREATGLVDGGQAAASFIMNPVKIQQLKAIALNKERMPPKTTYFYPKVLSGLTVYKMDSQ